MVNDPNLIYIALVWDWRFLERSVHVEALGEDSKLVISHELTLLAQALQIKARQIGLIAATQKPGLQTQSQRARL